MENQTLEQITGGRMYFITHNDLDGILSWLFLAQMGYKLGGIYNMKTMYLREGISMNDCFAVDLDLAVPGVPSLGHHFHLFSSEDNFNPNKTFGISDKNQYQNLDNFMKPPMFKRKCPLSMALILHSLTKAPLPNNPLSRGWLLYADGLYQSYTRYKGNVKSWLRDMDLETLVEDLESKNKKEILTSIVSDIQVLGSDFNRGFKVTKTKSFPQCSFNPLELHLLTPLLKHLQQILYNTPNVEIPNLEPTENGHFCQFYLNDLVYQQLERKFHEGLVISHGVIRQNVVNVTLTRPLVEKDDIDLYRSRTARCVG